MNKEADLYADVQCIPVEDNIADIVVSFYLLEHVENPQNVLNEKYRVLKEGGELFMLVPLYWEEHEQPYDYFRFTRFGLEMMLNKSGFKEIEIEAINTTPSILGMHLARLFNLKILRYMVPVINYIFFKLELRSQKRAKLNNTKASNVMSFAVKGKK
jgi:SAM-dependent methyltransferase